MAKRTFLRIIQKGVFILRYKHMDDPVGVFIFGRFHAPAPNGDNYSIWLYCGGAIFRGYSNRRIKQRRTSD